jgi:hypothetical protein
MKVMAMHKVDAAIEAGQLPANELIQSMGALIGDMMKEGAFTGGEGLQRSATRARVHANGKIERGPYAGRNELVAGFCLLRAGSFDEALDWSGRIARALGDQGEVELGPIMEPWDLGVMPKPAASIQRFLALAKADAQSEAGVPFAARVAPVVAELKRANALIATDGLAPSSQAKRAIYRRDRRKIVDGPFAESKELIAGFSMLDVPSWEKMYEWMDRFAHVLGGDVEIDFRPLA